MIMSERCLRMRTSENWEFKLVINIRKLADWLPTLLKYFKGGKIRGFRIVLSYPILLLGQTSSISHDH